MKPLFYAYLDDFNQVTILLPKNYFHGQSKSFHLVNLHDEIELYIEEVFDIGEFIKYICLLPSFIELGILFFVRDEYGNEAVLQSGAIVRSKRFDTIYYYEKKDLGVTYTEENTSFKLWSPTATKASLVLITDKKEIIEMKRRKKGIYEVTVDGDLDGYLYRYLVTNNNKEREILDIYGIASNANHEYNAVINPKKLLEVKPLENPIQYPTDAIVYEMSIRDFTIEKHSGVKYKGKYLGLCEKNTKTVKNHPTGLDYLIELGITHVQLLPFFDFSGIDELEPETAYNWGYNPEQYNVPEGSYSLKPNDVYSRLNELRQMISAFHENHIGVVMDVVYNHVALFETFPFNAMVPGYFYRYNAYGMPTNGSGCGNDVATEREMVRKFIIDSIKYWARNYKIDGFRFDLMGMIDIETMNRIRRELYDINPHILLYGEGWNLDTALPNDLKSSIENAYKLPGIAFFNDRYRDLIKGHTFEIQGIGYAFGEFSKVLEVTQLLSGSIGHPHAKRYLFYEPYQTINYIECHDNMTMYDKIKIALGEDNKEIRIKKQKLANSMLILSQGIPFIHSGQEFYRTKYGEKNSYNLPDKINMINWKRMDDYFNDVMYLKELIKVRKFFSIFHCKKASKIKKHLSFKEVEKGILIMTFNDIASYTVFQTIEVIFNCTSDGYVHKFTEDYQLIFDEKAYLLGKDIPNYYLVKAFSVIILAKKNLSL